MIKNTINKAIDKSIEAAIKTYPTIEKYNTTIRWGEAEGMRKDGKLGFITIYSNKDVIIEINPYQDCLDLLQTIRHELAHLVQYEKGYKLKHGKKFKKILAKIDRAWLKGMMK